MTWCSGGRLVADQALSLMKSLQNQRPFSRDYEWIFNRERQLAEAIR
jgi:hypothetical protein